MDKTVELVSSNTFVKLYAWLVRQDEQKNRILGIPQKEDPCDPKIKESKDIT
jgi:hypothetical protein